MTHCGPRRTQSFVPFLELCAIRWFHFGTFDANVIPIRTQHSATGFGKRFVHGSTNLFAAVSVDLLKQ